MKQWMRAVATAVFILGMAWNAAWSATPAEPMAALKIPVDEVISLLKDPQWKEPGREVAQREKIMTVVGTIFDFTEVSKRTLAQNWKRFNPQQRKEFTEVFGDFLGFTYYKKVRDSYQGETVVYLAQEMNGSDKAVVKTKIPRPAGDIPLDYRMLKRRENWRVYDVVIEGVSLVQNYRTQFKKILDKETPDQLIAKLKEKTAQQKNDSEKEP
ncbi:MAG: MlaC/ttg2D family ABC transporter substrate-binding protein [Thermodesulfobacteriota bacterium]